MRNIWLEMGSTDLMVLARVCRANERGQSPCTPERGEGKAFKRLQDRGFLTRNPTNRRQYIPSEKGEQACLAFLAMLQVL